MKSFMVRRCPRLTVWWYMSGRISWPMRLVSARARRRHDESAESGAAIRAALRRIQTEWEGGA